VEMRVRPEEATSTSARADDAELVRAAAAGDERAFTELYLRHAAAVARTAYRLVGDAHLDDVVQEIFLHAAPRLAGLRDPQRLRGWLITIAVRRARRLLRRQSWRRRALRVWKWILLGGEEHDRARATAEDVRDALGRLEVADRIAWTLHHVEGASLIETAAACEVSLATVKRRIAKAEARLKETLDDA
jgi:RNA polymerase sigma-70 factor, ECF subfamily